jgi:uncharacterized protein YacL
MFRQLKTEVKQQVVTKTADKVADKVVEKGQEFITTNFSKPVPPSVSTFVPTSVQALVQDSPKKVFTARLSDVKDTVKKTVEEEVSTKINVCVFSMLVSYLIGFFTTLEYTKPVHPVLSVPVFSILAMTFCYYVMRYMMKNIKQRICITVFSGLFVGALTRYLSIQLGQYKLITEDQPLLLFPLFGVCTLCFVGLFKYVFEISKSYDERWSMFKTD